MHAPVEIEFDPAKDMLNIAKHGISLARAIEMDGVVVIEDDRFPERRIRLYGTIDDRPHCAAATLRGDVVRIISLRRTHQKEYRRHVR